MIPKITALRASLFLVFLALALPAVALAESSAIQQPLSLTGPRFQIEELTAQLHSDDTVIAVAGKVRNLSHRPVAGHVVVYFLNAAGGVVFATESPVNDHSPIAHGDTGQFETAVSTKHTPATNNVSVEFVADSR